MIYVRKSRFIILIAASLCAITACSKGAEKAQPAVAVSNDPVTLTVFNSSMSDALFQTAFAEPVQKKYPFIKIEMVKKEKGKMLEDLIASGAVPDIIMGDSSGDILVYKELNVLDDMSPLMRKYNFDLNKLDASVLSNAKTYTGSDKILALPRSNNVEALYYNKDIFDKFGAPYPKDGMTWDDAIELAKKVTKLDGGVQYRGLDITEHILIPYNQLSLSIIDSVTGKAAVNNDQWKLWFETMRRMYTMDSGKPPVADYGGKASTLFLKDKTIAMFASTAMTGALPDAVKGGLNWDVVTLPSFKEVPDTAIQMFAPFLGVSPTSTHKDQAFMAIAHTLSEEVQLAESKQGRATVLNNPEIKKVYGIDNPVYQGKNKDALVKPKIAPAAKSVTKYDPTAYGVLRNKFKEVVLTDKDVNTALREAEDQINQEISKLKLN